MSYCGNCGVQLNEDSIFCHECGAPVTMIKAYCGNKREFSLLGRTLSVNKSKDVYNYYRKKFMLLAKYYADQLCNEYNRRITDLDSFLQDFPVMYVHYRQPLINLAISILVELGIYDVSFQVFEKQHTNDFCLCEQDLQVVITSFNMTLEQNQQQKIKNYNMMSGFVGFGIGGIIAATALNMTIEGIAEASIRNADVSPRQRREIMSRIQPSLLIEHAYMDYWNVCVSLMLWMEKKQIDVWYPKIVAEQKTEALFQNIITGKIPENAIPDTIIMMLMEHPYNVNFYRYLCSKYGNTEEIVALTRYFEF